MRFNDGKALGGMECVCTDLAGCDMRMAQNVKDLGTAVGVSSPQKGKGKEKGKRKHEEKGKHQVKGNNKRGRMHRRVGRCNCIGPVVRHGRLVDDVVAI